MNAVEESVPETAADEAEQVEGGWMEEEQTLFEETASAMQIACGEFNMAAILGALQPLATWEVSCRNLSNFGSACAHRGMVVRNKSLVSGYDLNKRDDVNRVVKECWEKAPWRIWFSPSCVMPDLFDKTQADYEANLRKKRAKTKKQLEHFVEIATAYLDANHRGLVYVEIPTEAAGTLRSPGVKAFKDLLQQRGFRLHRARIDGCMVGMCSSTGIPIRKQYTVIHNDAQFHEKMNVLCDGSHGQCPRTKMFLETAAYPEGMIERTAARGRANQNC